MKHFHIYYLIWCPQQLCVAVVSAILHSGIERQKLKWVASSHVVTYIWQNQILSWSLLTLRLTFFILCTLIHMFERTIVYKRNSIFFYYSWAEMIWNGQKLNNSIFQIVFSTHNRADQKKDRLIYEVNSMLLNVQVECCRKIKSVVVCILFNLLQDCMLELWRLLPSWTVWFPYIVHSTLEYISIWKLKLIIVYLVE